jgi:hypothetical protein
VRRVLCRRQIVFLALAGEPWNYMGSRRLMWDLARGGTPFTAGLDLADVDQASSSGVVVVVVVVVM